MSFERPNTQTNTQTQPLDGFQAQTNHPQTMHMPHPTHPTIATLPTNPNIQDTQMAQTQPMTNMTHTQTITNMTQPITNITQPQGSDLIGIVDYSAKSFIVFGASTKIHKDHLKSLGGKFNGRLGSRTGFGGGAAWIYPIQRKPDVSEFVNQVNSGNISTHQTVPQQGPQGALPTVAIPHQNNMYQSVRWKVFIPRDGMIVTIKANGTQLLGVVIQTETNRNVVDTAYINMDGNTSKLVICNGKWLVWGYMVEHSVFFSKPVTEVSGYGATGGYTGTTGGYGTTGTDEKDVYADIAGI